MKLNYEIALERLATDSADKKVLELLSATKGFQISELTSLSAKQLLTIAEKLDITEASMRMALSRQTKQGKLIRNKGKYALAKSLNPFVLPRFWLDIKHRKMHWCGDWLLINQGDLKLNPTILRRLNNKAELLGLKFIQSLGWVRPNNLVDLREEVLFHFNAVIEQSGLLICYLKEIDKQWLAQLMQSWPVQQLNQFYTDAYEMISNECDLIAKATDREVLIRSFAIGRLLVENLSKDPWLPAEMIDESARTRLIDQSVEYYEQIKPAWLKVMV
ncbi:phenylacetic acid degradation operon negative regulatory protein [Aliiglaciecola lipolytica]|uniref:Phenylacetic acid degradation operon negative regulatory protein n=1 Tax=Aliiglaciecola lipolytica E3 TaxID=1127673 RepID=K6XSJ2_9ALTE|nr:phenylacetic acid degradation operon negative regulatory protein [Aliiglaciecola lipolytica]GAC14656.1 phenylacetic acid degradation operon negative regulatory protein [Aliiglaciecola lipolytica E3]